jgi:hypothetical protein
LTSQKAKGVVCATPFGTSTQPFANQVTNIQSHQCGCRGCLPDGPCVADVAVDRAYRVRLNALDREFSYWDLVPAAVREAS